MKQLNGGCVGCGVAHAHHAFSPDADHEGWHDDESRGERSQEVHERVGIQRATAGAAETWLGRRKWISPGGVVGR